jgi:DnaA family protein
MAEQLSLELEQPLRYSSASFLLHSGVSEVVRSVNTLLALQSMPLLYIQGEPQSGKTHVGVYLAGRHVESVQGRGAVDGPPGGGARMVAAPDFVTWFSEVLPQEPIGFGELVVIDDADLLLQRHSAVAGSEVDVAGSFVDLCERVARAKGVLLLLGSVPLDAWNVLPQIASRLKAGLSFVIGDPQESELDGLLDAIAKQRGLKLSETKRQFIMRRVPRSLGALVECVERVQRFGIDALPSTSYQKLSDAVVGRDRR